MNLAIVSAVLLSYQFAGANKTTKPAPIPADFNLVAIGRNNVQMEQNIWKSGDRAIPAGLRTIMNKRLKAIPKMNPDVKGYTYSFGFSNSPSISNASILVEYGNLNKTTKAFTRSFGGSLYGWRSTSQGFLTVEGQTRLPSTGQTPQLSILFAAGQKTALGKLTRGADGIFSFTGTNSSLVTIEVNNSNGQRVTMSFPGNGNAVEISANYVGVRLGQVSLFKANENLKLTLDTDDPKITSVELFTRPATQKVYQDLELIPVLGL